MKIIDTRFRPGTKETLQGILHNPLYRAFSEATGFARRVPRTLAEEVTMLGELGVVKAVVTGRDIASTVDTDSTNPGMIESVQGFPELFMGFYGLDPHLGMSSLREFKHSVAEYGLTGASIDPGMARLPVNDARYYPLYAACCELDIPVAVTTGCSMGMPGVRLEHMAPWLIDSVACDFPELRLVISHGGYPWISEAIAVALRHSNVYMDFSASLHLPQAKLYIEAANGALQNKVLFASAHPFEAIADTLRLYAARSFTMETRTCLMYKNAVRFLRLSV